MKKIIIIFCCALLLFSCGRNDKKSQYTSTKKTPYLDPNFKYIHLIPDSLRTPEQKKFLMDIQMIIVKHLTCVNNKMVLTINEQQFVQKGFPKEYYVLIQKSLNENNEFFEKHHIKNVDQIVKDSFKEFK